MRAGWRYACGGLALAFALLVALPALSGRSVVSYASSGSMEPTIATFDVFLVNPWPGTIHPGDIIVFESQLKGGPAVHRAVSGDAAGWFTEGDANGHTDQSVGEPIVTPDKILGRVVTFSDGRPIVLHHAAIPLIDAKDRSDVLAQKLGGPARVITYALVLVIAALAIPALAGREKKQPARPLRSATRRRLLKLFPRGVRGAHVGLAFLALLLLLSTVAAHGSRSDLPVTMVVLQDPSAADGIRAAGPGGVVHGEVAVGALGFLPTIVILEGREPSVAPDTRVLILPPMRAATVGYEQTGGAVVGAQEDALKVTRYPFFLPPTWIDALHRAAPGSPDVALAGAFALVGAIWLRATGLSAQPVGPMLGLREAWR